MPTPDETMDDFVGFFSNLSEAIRAKRHFPESRQNRIRGGTPMCDLSCDDAARTTETILKEFFGHKGWKQEGLGAMREVWSKAVPDALKKMVFKHDEGMSTAASIYKSAESAILSANPFIKGAEIVSLADYAERKANTGADNDALTAQL